jgi:hypothetical protein
MIKHNRKKIKEGFYVPSAKQDGTYSSLHGKGISIDEEDEINVGASFAKKFFKENAKLRRPSRARIRERLNRKREAASGPDMDKLVDFLSKAVKGQISENKMIFVGFNLSSPAANNESKLAPVLAQKMGLKISEDDLRAALSEIGAKAASDVVNYWLQTTGNHLRNPTEGVRESFRSKARTRKGLREAGPFKDFSVGENDDGTPYFSAWFIDPAIDTDNELQVIYQPEDDDYYVMASDGDEVDIDDLSVDISIDIFPPEIRARAKRESTRSRRRGFKEADESESSYSNEEISGENAEVFEAFYGDVKAQIVDLITNAFCDAIDEENGIGLDVSSPEMQAVSIKAAKKFIQEVEDEMLEVIRSFAM